MALSKSFKIFKWALFLSIAFAIFCNIYIKQTTKEKIFNSRLAIPKTKYGLLLGTSKYLVDSGVNHYYTARINAASELYKNGFIEKIIVSGDNREPNYDEPSRMKISLTDLGVPEHNIIKDANGLNTLLSIQNFRNNYPNENLIIISQQFQNERAIYISNKLKVNAVAFNAKGLPVWVDLKTYTREFFAKAKCFIELF